MTPGAKLNLTTISGSDWRAMFAAFRAGTTPNNVKQQIQQMTATITEQQVVEWAAETAKLHPGIRINVLCAGAKPIYACYEEDPLSYGFGDTVKEALEQALSKDRVTNLRKEAAQLIQLADEIEKGLSA